MISFMVSGGSFNTPVYPEVRALSRDACENYFSKLSRFM